MPAQHRRARRETLHAAQANPCRSMTHARQAYLILTDAQHLVWRLLTLPFRPCHHPRSGCSPAFRAATFAGIGDGRSGLGDEMSRLAIACCALFVLVFTGGLNPEPKHEGLLLVSLTLLIYMAAFSVTKAKKKQKS